MPLTHSSKDNPYFTSTTAAAIDTCIAYTDQHGQRLMARPRLSDMPTPHRAPVQGSAAGTERAEAEGTRLWLATGTEDGGTMLSTSPG